MMEGKVSSSFEKQKINALQGEEKEENIFTLPASPSSFIILFPRPLLRSVLASFLLFSS